MSWSEIADRLGYSSVAHLNNQFKKTTGPVGVKALLCESCIINRKLCNKHSMQATHLCLMDASPDSYSTSLQILHGRSVKRGTAKAQRTQRRRKPASIAPLPFNFKPNAFSQIGMAARIAPAKCGLPDQLDGLFLSSLMLLINMKFKTNIKCDGCIATVTPILDQAVGAGNWSVDLGSPLRTLALSNVAVSPNEIKARLATVGYQADEIDG